MKTIGIIGGGQLGRMLSQAAKRMGFGVAVLDPTPNAPASAFADKQILGSFKDEEKIRELAKESQVLTFEIELASSEALREFLEKGLAVHPSPVTLAIIKDKFGQKNFLKAAGIPVADFQKVDTVDDARLAGQKFGYPFMLKARFDAYDGRGNARINSPQEIDAAFLKLGGKDLYAEQWVPFTRELAVVAVRGAQSEIRTYPVVETIHKNNICHMVLAPAQVSEGVQSAARDLAMKVLAALKGVGVFGIEMFLLRSDQVLINEIAPRVHNSGHFTIEGSETSQFENHIRAITEMPLGSTAMKHPAAVMINILGDRTGAADPHGVEAALKIPGVAVHLYGKHETRPERKMGHITAIAGTLEKARENAEAARKLITI